MVVSWAAAVVAIQGMMEVIVVVVPARLVD